MTVSDFLINLIPLAVVANRITFLFLPRRFQECLRLRQKVCHAGQANKVRCLWRAKVQRRIWRNSGEDLMVLKYAHPLMRTLQNLFIPAPHAKLTAVYLTFIVYAPCSVHLTQQDKRSRISLGKWDKGK